MGVKAEKFRKRQKENLEKRSNVTETKEKQDLKEDLRVSNIT